MAKAAGFIAKLLVAGDSVLQLGFAPAGSPSRDACPARGLETGGGMVSHDELILGGSPAGTCIALKLLSLSLASSRLISELVSALMGDAVTSNVSSQLPQRNELFAMVVKPN